MMHTESSHRFISISTDANALAPLMISPAIGNEITTMHIERNTCATVVWHCDDHYDKTRLHITLHQNASLSLYILQNETGRHEVEMLLLGEGAQAQVRGIVALNKDEAVTITTRQEHRAAHTKSDVAIKSLLAGSAQFMHEGLIEVNKTARDTYASQQNKNILLSSQARAYSRPSLEVKTNEVKCVHGTATGPLDKNQLLYLVSRGISSTQARHILLRGFIAEIIKELPDSMQESLLNSAMEKIEEE